MIPATFATIPKSDPAAAINASTSALNGHVGWDQRNSQALCFKNASSFSQRGFVDIAPDDVRPSRASRRTVARPMPLPAPVTITFFPVWRVVSMRISQRRCGPPPLSTS